MSPLNKEEQRCLLRLARQAIGSSLTGTPLDPATLASRLPSERLCQPGAAFVSLHRHRQLRGCVGYIQPTKPLYQAVAECAVSAALRDPRFEPVTPEEVPELEIEISVLSPLFPIAPEEVKPGEHGLLVRQGFYRGLLLPQVARDYGWGREQFLEETCVKAGLERDAWKKDTRIEAFTAFVFSEATLRELEPSRP